MSANWAQTQGFIPQILTLPPCLACATASPWGTAAATAAAPGSCSGSSWGQRHTHCCSGSSCCHRGQGQGPRHQLWQQLPQQSSSLRGCCWAAALLIEQSFITQKHALARMGAQAVSNKSLQQSALRFITACINMSPETKLVTEAMTFLSTLLAAAYRLFLNKDLQLTLSNSSTMVVTCTHAILW